MRHPPILTATLLLVLGGASSAEEALDAPSAALCEVLKARGPDPDPTLEECAGISEALKSKIGVEGLEAFTACLRTKEKIGAAELDACAPPTIATREARAPDIERVCAHLKAHFDEPRDTTTDAELCREGYVDVFEGLGPKWFGGFADCLTAKKPLGSGDVDVCLAEAWEGKDSAEACQRVGGDEEARATCHANLERLAARLNYPAMRHAIQCVTRLPSGLAVPERCVREGEQLHARLERLCAHMKAQAVGYTAEDYEACRQHFDGARRSLGDRYFGRFIDCMIAHAPLKEEDYGACVMRWKIGNGGESVCAQIAAHPEVKLRLDLEACVEKLEAADAKLGAGKMRGVIGCIMQRPAPSALDLEACVKGG